MKTVSKQLLARYPLVSDQVVPAQVGAILDELERVSARGVNGAVVEFGCYIGTTSLFIRRLLDELHDSREFHVYDSFEGLPAKTAADHSPSGIQFTAGELQVSKKQFIREFQKAHVTPPVVHKGWFKDLTPQDVPEQISLAFLDGDFYESIRDSLKLVLPCMQPGGVIIVDDYAREALPGAAKAVHEQLPHALVQTVHNLGIIRLRACEVIVNLRTEA